MKTFFKSLFFRIMKTQGESAMRNLCNKHLSMYVYVHTPVRVGHSWAPGMGPGDRAASGDFSA